MDLRQRIARRFAKELGEAGVDSGMLLVIDPSYIKYWDTGEHPELGPDSIYKNRSQLRFENGMPAAVLIHGTGFGDGSYPVRVHETGPDFSGQERIWSVVLDFKPDNMVAKVARRFIAREGQYFIEGDVILFGKYKNHKGKIVSFGKDKWGNPTVEIEPIPKGRKQNKIMGLFRIWRADVKEKALAEQKAEEEAQKALTARVSEHHAALTYLPLGESGVKGLASPEEDHFGWQYPMGFLDAGPLPHFASKRVVSKYRLTNACKSFHTRSATHLPLPVELSNHPALTSGLTQIYTNPFEIGYIGVIDGGPWIAFVDVNGKALLWTARDPSGGIIGDPYVFRRVDLVDAPVLTIPNPVNDPKLRALMGVI